MSSTSASSVVNNSKIKYTTQEMQHSGICQPTDNQSANDVRNIMTPVLMPK